MPSPFPGMDPYLEAQRWRSFHLGFLAEARRSLNPRLLPRYVADVEETLWLEDLDGDREGNASFRWSDLSVEAAEDGPFATAASAGGSVATLEPRAMTRPRRTQRQRRIQIFAVPSRRLVTVIELLSPANKTNPGRRQYLTKQADLLSSGINLVEIDLLRAGQRLPTQEDLPDADYFAFVSTPDPAETESVAVYSWGLRDRLPTLPVPLAGDDPAVPLDLHAVCTDLYEASAYAVLLDYTRPLTPPLPPDDAAWVAERLAAAGAEGG